MSRQRALAAGTRLPDWMGSVRFRLTLIYSLMLFGLAAIVVGAIYLAVSRSIADPLADEMPAEIPLEVIEADDAERLQVFEKEVKRRTLVNLRRYSFLAMGSLFVGSLAVGWFVAGRVLAPIDRIRKVAEEIRATDLTRRIALAGPEDELKQLADTFDGMISRLDVAFESQRRFIQEASHELRNPLAVIRTSVDVALADDTPTVEELHETAEVVERAAARMSTLVDDLLLSARHERPVLDNVPVELGRLVSDTAVDFAAQGESGGVSVTAEVHEPVWVHGDEVALRRALANLAANAVRLSPSGSIVTIGAAPDHRGARLWVADEGPGIEPAFQDQIFQRFWKGRDEPARSGLGLTIVRQIAEAHGATVAVDSAPGEGAVFTLRFAAQAHTTAGGNGRRRRVGGGARAAT